MKKHIYFVLIILLCSVLIFFLVASSREAVITEEVNVVDVFRQQQEVMNNVSSCRTNVYLEMSIEAGTGTNDMSINANMISNIDTNKYQLSSVIETTVVMNKNKKETKVTIIGDDNKVYMKQGKINDESLSWEVEQLNTDETAALWEEQRRQITGLDYTTIIVPEDFIYVGEEKSGGRICYVFTQPINIEKMLESDTDFNNQLEGVEGFMPRDLEKMLESGDVTCLIDKETMYLREIRLDTILSYDVAGEAVLGMLKQYCRYDDFNEPISIEIPMSDS